MNVFPWGKDHKIEFKMDLSDDYGLSEAYISATVAKGSGEAVKFRERRFELSSFRKGRKSFTGRHSFSTSALDMGPGDELYFYVRAKDNCPYEQQWTKSQTYFVLIQDTTTYDLFTASGMQVDVLPEFFRSQRQIIIDSEQLLSDKNKISKDSFKQGEQYPGL